MSNVHNPDQYMASLRTLIAQGRKRIGLLIGAGAPAGMACADGDRPLIPAVVGLTKQVLTSLEGRYGTQFNALREELSTHDIESILSRVRALSRVIGTSKVHGLDATGYSELSGAICAEIGRVVNVRLPSSETAYSDLVNWIAGTAREHPVEIFTTNYDVLLEEALERVRAPYFDGFVGGHEPFFDPVSVAKNDLPARWVRLWKIHGSLGWRAGVRGDVIRTGDRSATHLVFPEHMKYDLTQKAPYASLLDRLQAFLESPDTLLLSIGFSFADAHIVSRIDEALAGNPSASVFAFQYRRLDDESFASSLAARLPNFSVYARDGAVINGTRGSWAVPQELPSRDWLPIRASYWGRHDGQARVEEFLLGGIEEFARFFAASRSPLGSPAANAPQASGERS